MKRLFSILTAIALTISGTYFAGTAIAAARSAPSLSAVTQDDSTARVMAKWKPVCDMRGCADSVVVEWRVNGVLKRTLSSKATVDTIAVVLPAWGDTAVVQIAVTSMRRNLKSGTRTASVTLRRADAAPPAPDSLQIDTLAKSPVDSMRMVAYSSAGYPITDSLKRIVEGDSMRFVAQFWKNDTVVDYPNAGMSWALQNTDIDPKLLLEIHEDRASNSMWLLVKDCQCRPDGEKWAYDVDTGKMEPMPRSVMNQRRG